MKGKIAAVAALVTATLAVSGGVASAAPAGKLDSQAIGNIRIDPNDATVAYGTARYIFEGGAGAHVWVSARQAESRRPEQWLTEEGSVAASAAWSHSDRNAAVWDGTWQVGTFTIDQVEWGWGQLTQG